MIIFENGKIKKFNKFDNFKNIIEINKVKDYNSEIIQILKNQKDIKEFTVSTRTSLNYSFGITNNNIGSVYSPISVDEDFYGSLLIIWKDNRISIIDLDSDKIINFKDYLSFFREISYEEKFIPEIQKDQKYIDYKSFDSEILDDILSNNFEIFNKSFELFHFFKENGVKFSNVDSLYSLDFEIYYNTQDIYFGKFYSSNIINYDFDSLIYYSCGKNKKLNEENLNEFKKYFSVFFHNFKQIEYQKINTDNIIFLSYPFYSLLNFYLGYNIEGANIYYKKSYFSIEDFNKNSKISEKPFNLYFDPLIDYEFSSYPISPEGITPEKTYYIKDGNLVQPSISLKASKMLNLKPNNGFGNGKLEFEPIDDSLLNFINKLEDCYIIFDILGLHTQDPISGNFSLSVSTGLLKEEGKFKGLIKGNINGNFFDLLKNGNFKILKNDFNNKYSFFTKLKIIN